MGGPWKVRGFNPTEWRAPVSRGEATAPAGAGGGAAFVLAYLVSVLLSVAAMILLLKSGW